MRASSWMRVFFRNILKIRDYIRLNNGPTDKI